MRLALRHILKVRARSLRPHNYAIASYSTTRKGSHEQVTVAVGTSGHIRLDIHHPATPPPSTPRIILNLPSQNPSPFHTDSPSTAQSDRSASHFNAAQLASTAGATVVTPHYRLSATHPFPTPTHDIARAYDWILKNLFPSRAHVPRIAVTGDHVGGSLALALALTECRATSNREYGDARDERPSGIVAVAAHSPIVDWVFESDALFSSALPPRLPEPKARKRNANTNTTTTDASTDASTNTSPPDPDHNAKIALQQQHRHHQISDLYALRAACFPATHPTRYHDPFASPIHFLRSASRPAPPSRPSPHKPGTVEDEQFATLTGLDDALAHGVASTSAGAEEARQEVPGEIATDGRKYRRALRFPPTGSGLLLPRVRMSVDAASMLRGQGEDMVRLLRKAWVARAVREIEERGGGLEGVAAGLWEDAERGVEFGVWCGAAGGLGGREWEEEARSMGEWMGGMLD